MFLEITAPLGVLELLHVPALPEGTSVEFERTASVLADGSSSLVVLGDREAVESTLHESLSLDSVTLVAEVGDESLFRLRWVDALPRLIQCIREADGTILSATAVGDAWRFELRFTDQGSASRFYDLCDDPDYPITIRRSGRDVPAHRASQALLTAAQREALVRAVESGYFEVPRRTTLTTLAHELNISDTATSQRLRRGMSNLLQASVYTPEVAPPNSDDD